MIRTIATIFGIILSILLLIVNIDIIFRGSLVTPREEKILKRAITTNPTSNQDNKIFKGQFPTGMSACLEKEGLYFGDIRQGKKQGYGIYIASNGKKIPNCHGAKYYVGYWTDDIINGVGICYDKKGKPIYFDEFNDGKPTETYPSNDLLSSHMFLTKDLKDGKTYIGEIYDGEMGGVGIYAWENGDIWIGNLQNDFRYGRGISIASDGNLETGLWNDLFDGFDPTEMNPSQTGEEILKQIISNYPTFSFSNGDKLKGQVLAGNISKMSAYLFSNDGCMYFGEWQWGTRNGYGIFMVPDGMQVINCPGTKYYVGNWLNDEKSGTGYCYDKYGDLLYYGIFKDNKPANLYPAIGGRPLRSFRTVHFTDGTRYIGELWNDELRDGYGMLAWEDGEIWIGPFKDGIRTGKGISIDASGNIVVGIWEGNHCDLLPGVCKVCQGAGITKVDNPAYAYAIYKSVPKFIWFTCKACDGQGIKK